jgi:protein TonB
MTGLISLLAALAAFQAPAAEPEVARPAPTLAQADDWLRKPTVADLMRFYPERATKDLVSGEVTVACSVDRRGALYRCGVLAETPAGYGFGDAALKVAQTFSMRPERAVNWAAGDRRVLVPVSFRPPGQGVNPSEEWAPRPYRLQRLPRPTAT